MQKQTEEQKLIKRIQDALGTAETGEALIEVARNAHKCEMELASMHNLDDDPFNPMNTIDPDHSDTFK
jgi:hypothetical protein